MSLPPASEPPGEPGRAPSAEPPWRSVRLGDALALAIPAHWADSPVLAANGFTRWLARDWCNPDLTLWVGLASAGVEGPDRLPAGSVGPWLLGRLRRRTEDDPGRRLVSATSAADRAVLRTVQTAAPSDGVPFRYHRWHVAELQAGRILEATAMLTMPVAHEHEPHQTRLVERFAAELPRLHFLGGPAAPVVDGDPYREWATITCFGGIRIRVPAAWHCGYDVDVFMWSGYRPGDSWEEHSGVIWLTYDLPADTAAGQRQPDAGALEIPVPEDALDVRRDLASGEQVLRYRQVGDEDGKAVVFTRWMRGIVRDRRLILLQVSLAFPETRAKTPVVARFIEAMDVEVRAAEIDVTKLSMAWTSP